MELEQDPVLPASKLPTLAASSSAVKAPTPASQFSQIIRAVTDGNLPLVTSLLDATDASVNTKSRGTTALHDACKAGHSAIVEALIARRAEVNTVNRSGCTALHFATLSKDKHSGLSIVKRLLDATAHVNVTNERMDTPLHYAAYCEPVAGAADIVSELLSKRALVNVRNRSSDSPLINAALNNHVDAVKVLLERKADHLQRNATEKTAQDIARERGCTEALRILEQMQDPLTQLSDTTELMRTALSQMQTVDMLSADLRRQTLLTEAYESFAVAAVADMEDSARARLVHEALNALQERRSEKDSDGHCKLGPARQPLTPQQFSQALVTLLLISRSRSGSALLCHSGVHEVLPSMEQLATVNNIGHKELRELRGSLQKSQVELLEMSVDRSCSSESTSSIDRCRQSKSPTTPSTGVMCETPSTTTSGDCDARMPRRKVPNQSRLSVGSRVSTARHSSLPCIISRKILPLIDDERASTAEDLATKIISTDACDNEGSSSPRHGQEVVDRSSMHGDEECYFSHSSITKMPSTLSSGLRVSFLKLGHLSDKGEALGEDSTQVSTAVTSAALQSALTSAALQSAVTSAALQSARSSGRLDTSESALPKEEDKVDKRPRPEHVGIIPEDAHIPVARFTTQSSDRTTASKSCSCS